MELSRAFPPLLLPFLLGPYLTGWTLIISLTMSIEQVLKKAFDSG